MSLECPAGVPVAMCSYIPCEKASCPGDSSAVCRNSFCGGCKAVFYTQSGEKSNCLLKGKLSLFYASIDFFFNLLLFLLYSINNVYQVSFIISSICLSVLKDFLLC